MKLTISKIKKRITEELVHIHDDQLPDGSFLSMSAQSPDLHHAEIHKTVFTTSLILTCLENVSSNAHAKKIIRKGLHFLLHEKSVRWSWNYWPRSQNKKSTDEPHGAKLRKIPDDMDDTFAAALALSIHRPDLVTDAAISKLLAHLQQTKHLLTGLHNTWITDYRAQPAWDDIDIVVNSTIGYFLTRCGIATSEISNTIQLVLRETAQEGLISQYYLSTVTAFYFISRFLGNKTPRPAYFSRPKNVCTSALTTALALSTLMHMETPKEKLTPYAERLLEQPWEAAGLYIESRKNKINFYAGSDALTAAFCIEALSKYILYE